MKQLIKRVIKKISFKVAVPNVEKSENTHVKCSDKNATKGLKLVLRNSIPNKVYMEIGNDSIVNGTYVFETEGGKISIGDRTFIGSGTFICIQEIEIGNDVMFSWGCTIVDNNSHSVKWSERKDDVINWKKGLDENNVGAYKDWTNVKRSKITIKDKVWIGFNSIILKGVTIGEGAIVGSGSVVTKDVPDWTIVAGNPAQIIREIPENER